MIDIERSRSKLSMPNVDNNSMGIKRNRHIDYEIGLSIDVKEYIWVSEKDMWIRFIFYVWSNYEKVVKHTIVGLKEYWRVVCPT